jgi:hypothetical protein
LSSDHLKIHEITSLLDYISLIQKMKIHKCYLLRYARAGLLVPPLLRCQQAQREGGRGAEGERLAVAICSRQHRTVKGPGPLNVRVLTTKLAATTPRKKVCYSTVALLCPLILEGPPGSPDRSRLKKGLLARHPSWTPLHCGI